LAAARATALAAALAAAFAAARTAARAAALVAAGATTRATIRALPPRATALVANARAAAVARHASARIAAIARRATVVVVVMAGHPDCHHRRPRSNLLCALQRARRRCRSATTSKLACTDQIISRRVAFPYVDELFSDIRGARWVCIRFLESIKVPLRTAQRPRRFLPEHAAANARRLDRRAAAALVRQRNARRQPRRQQRGPYYARRHEYIIWHQRARSLL
jgi:hypothetical protein